MDLVDELVTAAAAAEGLTDDRGETTVYRRGTVIAANATTLRVNVDGVDVDWPAVRRVRSYIPVVGDAVACIRHGHRYVILDAIAETP